MKKRAVAGLVVLALAAGVIAIRVFRSGGPPSAAPHPSAIASAVARPKGPLAIAETIYDGKLGPGWEDWGWGPHELRDGSPAKVAFSSYGGIALHHRSVAPRIGGLVFRFKAPREWGDFMSVTLKDAEASEAAFPRVNVEPRHLVDLADGWREAWLSWKELNPSNLPVDRIMIGAYRQVASDWVLLDKIGLTKPDQASGVAAAPVREAKLAILCSEPVQPISPLIYGISHGVFSTGAPAFRIGGNPLTRYNWDLGVWNTGKDWFFENGKGGSMEEWVGGAARSGVVTAVVVPMIGWVSKDATSVGFPVSKLGKQQKTDPNKPDAGDGHHPDGKPMKPGPPTETSIAAPPSLVGRWVRELAEKDAAGGKRRVNMYILDNEPSLWNETHRDIHPDAVTYDELLDRTIRYGTEVRKADPDALIAGPAEWGWTGYFNSARDREVSLMLRPDRRAHGDVPLVEWYLKKLAEHEKTTGVRLLDVLDLHFYPAVEKIFGQNARTDPEGAALRLRATRALWDPTYLDESWIRDNVRLIPRMKEWVAKNYPGRKTMIGEWSFGADDHMSGALATAEALGRFGSEGLDAAYYWPGPMQTTRAFWAFRAFRNFDGKGARFQDFSIPTRGAENVSFFASRDQTGEHVVAIILNLDPIFAVRARIDAGTCGRLESRRAFSYSESSTELTEEASRTPPPDVELVPPYSIRVLNLRYTLLR
jgi:hypothetical protein